MPIYIISCCAGEGVTGGTESPLYHFPRQHVISFPVFTHTQTPMLTHRERAGERKGGKHRRSIHTYLVWHWHWHCQAIYICFSIQHYFGKWCDREFERTYTAPKTKRQQQQQQQTVLCRAQRRVKLRNWNWMEYEMNTSSTNVYLSAWIVEAV